MKGSNFFTVLVVGNNPDELLQKYCIYNKVPEYIKYEYSKAQDYLNNNIKVYEEIIKKPKSFLLSDFQLDFIKEKVNNLKKMSSEEFYNLLTQGLKLDKNKNALTDENPDGKWQTATLGKNFSLPFILKNGDATNTAINKDIDWSSMHMINTELYQLAWDLFHKIKEPKNEEEKHILENMSNRKNYFSTFKNSDEYIRYNCSYWNYAYLDNTGWYDLDSAASINDWINNYYERFILNLKLDDKLSIYECSKDKEEN